MRNKSTNIEESKNEMGKYDSINSKIISERNWLTRSVADIFSKTVGFIMNLFNKKRKINKT